MSKVINNEEIETILTQSTLNKDRVLSLSNLSDDQFGFYLAGLLEGNVSKSLRTCKANNANKLNTKRNFGHYLAGLSLTHLGSFRLGHIE